MAGKTWLQEPCCYNGKFACPPWILTRFEIFCPTAIPFFWWIGLRNWRATGSLASRTLPLMSRFFSATFPEYPVMPGVPIVEAMAQVAGVLVLKQIPDRKTKLVLLAGVDGAKFRRPVRPGDQLRMEIKVLRLRSSMAKVTAVATVEGVVVAEAEIMCVLADRH